MLPLILGIWTATSDSAWAGDLSVLRDLGGLPVGSEGLLSTLATQLVTSVPVGGRLLRAGLLGVIALAACGWLSYGLIRDLLDAHEPFALNPLLALIGCQLWAIDPDTLGETSRIGGPALALLIILASLRSMRDLSDARVFPLLGALTALGAAENHAAGVVLALTFGVRVMAAGRRLKPVLLHGWLTGLFATTAVCWGWRASRPWLTRGEIDLGFAAPARLVIEEVPVDGIVAWVQRLPELWLERLGPVTLCLALAGFVWVLLRSAELRRAMAPWLFMAGLAGLLPLAPITAHAPWLALLALSSTLGIAPFVALALVVAVRGLWACRLPFARPASVLAVSFALTLVLQHLDELAPAEAASALAAESWTEEAFGTLPPRSLILVQTPAVALRLLAARVLDGARPDIVIVPAPFLSSGAFMEQLLGREPELSPLLRQLTVHGLADEYSLSGLADVRPVFVELDPRWDARLLEHLRPEPMWLGFAPHALGAAERRAGVERSQAALRRMWRARARLDAATKNVVAASARDQAALLAALGARKDARRLLRVALRLNPAEPLARDLAARLDQARRGRVAIQDLLAAAE